MPPRCSNGGTLRHDREYALFDSDGDVVNGKRTGRVHHISVDFTPGSNALRVETREGDFRKFDLEEERETAEEWFGGFFDADLTLRRDTSLGFVDRRELGPSVVSTASIEAMASWFDGMTVESARRRLRANVEVSGVPAFWEDRFVGEDPPSFEVDGVRFEGVEHCGRCVVPQRDPDTGESIPGFRERFVDCRKSSLPDWADEEAFDHYYSLMIITKVSESDHGKTVSVGGEVETVE